MKIDAVRRHALGLPEVVEQPHFHYASFRVAGKIFVTVPPEQTHIHVFVSELERDRALAVHAAFVERLLWGGKVVGLRIELKAAPAASVKHLVEQAWAAKAPKRLLAGPR